ncbi:MAG: carboxymuconolactone decarboxylase family protein [Vicinamibacterales bacterium]
MERIAPLEPTIATGAVKPLFDGVQAKLGAVPNLFRVLGTAPAALSGYLNLSGALASGSFDGRLREQIALTVAETNHCGYCLSAHTFIGARLGLTEQAIADARHAVASTPRTDAILKLARAIVVCRGELGHGEFEAARAAGLTDGDVIETIANVAVNIFSNYVNHIAGTPIDFPEVTLGNGYSKPASSCA